jgi:hypothetical protein
MLTGALSGCGIGVLLRMMFVLIVLSYRMIRGEPEHPEIEFVEVLYDDYADAENLLVPPPQYVCEGAELVDAKEVKAEVKDEAKDVAEDETKNNEA